MNEIGTQLGPYKLLYQIGAGGMGEVFRAVDTRLGREVAVKVLPSRFTEDEEAVSRFERETKALAAISHPNILAIYDVGSENGVCYAVMELLEGETLRAKIKRGSVGLRRALEISIEIAEGLAAAHMKGIIHRDLKPENIYLTIEGGVKILDFGLVKVDKNASRLNSPAANIKDKRTTGNFVLGTPPYMSPEQLRKEEIDVRSDIFSLGCVIFEMTTGMTPFERSNEADVMAAILKDEPISFSQAGTDVPEEVEAAVLKCLQKSREDRHQSAHELIFELKKTGQSLNGDYSATAERSIPNSLESALNRDSDRITLKRFDNSGSFSGQDESRRENAATLSTNPINASATLSSAARASSKIFSINRTAYLAIGLSAFLAAISVIWFFAGMNKKDGAHINSLAVLPFAGSSEDPDTDYITEGITESITESISQLPKLRVIASSRVFVYKRRNVDPQMIGKEFKVDAVLTGRVVRNGDNLLITAELIDVSDGTRIWGVQYDRKLSDISATQSVIAQSIAQKLRDKLTGEDVKRITKRLTENPEAHQLYLKGRYYWNRRTPDSLNKSIEFYKQAIEIDPQYALAYAGMADSYNIFSVYGIQPPSESYPAAKAAAEKALELDDTLAEAHVSLASVTAFYDWDWASAEKEYKRAIELNPNYPTSHYWYGLFLTVGGRFEEALVEFKLAQQLDPLSLIIGTQAALPNFTMGRNDAAISQLKKVLEMDPNFVPALSLLGRVYVKTGKYAEAVAALEKAEKLSGSETYTAMVAWAYASWGKRKEAEKYLKQVREIANKKFVSPFEIAMVYAALGQKDKAFEELERAFELRSNFVVFLKYDPRADSLKSDPRFADLIRRIGV